jgi:diaminopimelate epimerase
MKIDFWKMSGAGNDFVILTGRRLVAKGPILARRLCDRHWGIGADGLIVVSRHGRRIRLDYWNADGSSAFCGNGSRCAAFWVAEHGWIKDKTFTVESSRGRLSINLVPPGRAEVLMPPPSDARLNLRVSALRMNWQTHLIDTGVPHAVVCVRNIETINVKDIGRALRFHKAFGPNGANVDFIEFKKGRVLLRTYERGVEDETLACGTGVVAAAAVARALHKGSNSISVTVRSGAHLKVRFNADETWLEGPVQELFSGVVNI